LERKPKVWLFPGNDFVAKTGGTDLVGWDAPITAVNPFKWRHYPSDVILWCVRVVSAVSDFGGANGGDDRGKRVGHQLELHLAVDSSVVRNWTNGAGDI
jgi:hypothetical protein